MLMLVCHHLGMGVLLPPINWGKDPFLTIIATLCKVCVAIFVILSGYGINESRKRRTESDILFVKNHLVRLMKQFWFIFVIFVPLGFLCQWKPTEVYGGGGRGFLYFAIDFFGMKSLFNTPTMNQTWWYMETVIVLYIAYPLLRRLVKKLPVITLAAAFVPIALGMKGFNAGTVDGCREIYWVFPFAVGIFLSQHDVLNRFSAFCAGHGAFAAVLSLASMLALTWARSRVGLVLDTFYALAIIAFAKATVCKVKYANSLFAYLGVHSANIFMMHSFLYCYFVPIKQLLFAVANPYFNYIFLILECVVVSDYIEVLKARMRQTRFLAKLV